MSFWYARVLTFLGNNRQMQALINDKDLSTAFRASFYLSSRGDEEALEFLCSKLTSPQCNLRKALTEFRNQKYSNAIFPLMEFLLDYKNINFQKTEWEEIVSCIVDIAKFTKPHNKFDKIFSRFIEILKAETRSLKSVDNFYIDLLIYTASVISKNKLTKYSLKDNVKRFSKIYMNLIRIVRAQILSKNINRSLVQNCIDSLNNSIKVFPMDDDVRLQLVYLSGDLSKIHEFSTHTDHTDSYSYIEEHAVCGGDYCDSSFSGETHYDVPGFSWRPAKLDF